MRLAGCARASLSVFSATALLVSGSAPAHAAGPRCGAVLTNSTTLRADVTGCTGDGLVVGADRITLDLNGHRVSGTGAAGIRVAGRRAVTVLDGKVEGFTNNVLLHGSTGNVFRRLRVRRSEGRGVEVLNGSDGNRFEQVASDEGRSGFRLQESNRNVLVHITASRNEFNGVFGVAADDNVVQDGVFADNGEAGVGFADGSDRNRIVTNTTSGSPGGVSAFFGDHNIIAGNRMIGGGVIVQGHRNLVVANTVTDLPGCPDGCGLGISVEGGTANLITGNFVARTARIGIHVDEYEVAGNAPPIDNVIRANVVRDSADAGIAVGTDSAGGGTITGTVIEANLVTGSGLDGIHVVTAGTTLTRNVALHNARLGIRAVDGVIDGGGNIAHFNGDPLQCLKISCR
jgi:hypothetical protein